MTNKTKGKSSVLLLLGNNKKLNPNGSGSGIGDI